MRAAQMGAGTSALTVIEAKGGRGPSGAGGLEHGVDPSAAAARVRTGGVRVLGALAFAALTLLVTARLTGNVRDKKLTHKTLPGAPPDLRLQQAQQAQAQQQQTQQAQQQAPKQ